MPKREPEPLLREDGVPVHYMRPLPEPVEEAVTSNASEGVVIEEPEAAPQEEKN